MWHQKLVKKYNSDSSKRLGVSVYRSLSIEKLRYSLGIQSVIDGRGIVDENRILIFFLVVVPELGLGFLQHTVEAFSILNTDYKTCASKLGNADILSACRPASLHTLYEDSSKLLSLLWHDLGRTPPYGDKNDITQNVVYINEYISEGGKKEEKIAITSWLEHKNLTRTTKRVEMRGKKRTPTRQDECSSMINFKRSSTKVFQSFKQLSVTSLTNKSWKVDIFESSICIKLAIRITWPMYPLLNLPSSLRMRERKKKKKHVN